MYDIVALPSEQRTSVRVMETAVALRELRDDDLEVLYQNQADPESAAMAGVEARDRDEFLTHQARVTADLEALQ